MTVIELFPDKQRPDVVNFTPKASSDVELPTWSAGTEASILMQGMQDYMGGPVSPPQLNGSTPDEAGTRSRRNDGEPSSTKKVKTSIKLERSPAKGRRKSRWKLKFHHQALPPEYLKHYKQQEKKRRQTEVKKTTTPQQPQQPLQQKNRTRKIVRKSVSDKISSLNTSSEIGASENAVKSSVESLECLGEEARGQERDKTANWEEAPTEAKTQERVGVRCRPREELLNPGPSIPPLNIGLDIPHNKAFLENLLTNQIEINRVEQKDRALSFARAPPPPVNKTKAKAEERSKRHTIPSSGKIMNYSDLPYMGEITLDGIKPRRGRKPKKADICHLIYKNYGQVFPGAPSSVPETYEPKKARPWKAEDLVRSRAAHTSLSAKAPSERMVESPLPSVSGIINHTEVQNRIINSLLERRLTQEMRLKAVAPQVQRSSGTEEPLNLCIRDLQSLKIKLSRKHGDYYETNKEKVEVKAEVEEVKKEVEVEVLEKTDSEEGTSDDEDDITPFNLVTTELRESSDEDSFLSFNDQVTLTKVDPHSKGASANLPVGLPELSPSSVMDWPNSPLFLPPSPLLFYERLAAEGGPPPLPFLPHPRATNERKSLKQRLPRAETARSPPVKRTAPKVNPNAAQVIAKRKRSAIFIPPVPAENTSNPTTEVSICKFKFTGGAKPSLQEKKMLSVDSGGNFRYYSGTGDKSMRGYEYFPRESLQQCQENTGYSPSGVFLTASALGTGEKIPDEIGHSGFFDSTFPIQVSPRGSDESPTPKPKAPKREERFSTFSDTKSETEDITILPDEERNSSENSEGYDLQNLMHKKYLEQMKGDEEEGTSKRRRSRKTRKSLAREKLEQTFKEKGFLIQTQQLESAEGATYCKFRQLRKFTRYLFRSWKDYLPGNVRDLSVDAGVEQPDLAGLPGLPGLPGLVQLPSPVKMEDKPFC